MSELNINANSSRYDLKALTDKVKSSLVKERYMVIDSFNNDVTAFYTTRLGGNSVAPYDSFNLAHHVGDDNEQVMQNRALVKADFGFERLCFMEQTHSSDVTIVDESNLDTPIFNCDGLVTKLKKTALAVMTADCLPLLLCDERNDVVAAIHCGWKGIERNIIGNAIDVMESQGAELSTIVPYLGPAIGPSSFEVGPEVKAIFEAKHPAHSQAFVLRDGVKTELGGPKYLCDIYKLAIIELESHGVTSRPFGGHCDTYMQSKVFYSYRKEKVTGRMASIICLN